MAHLAQHAFEHGRLLLLDGAADLAETERAQRAAVALALADLGADLGNAHLRHLTPRPSCGGGRGASASRAPPRGRAPPRRARVRAPAPPRPAPPRPAPRRPAPAQP